MIIMINVKSFHCCLFLFTGYKLMNIIKLYDMTRQSIVYFATVESLHERSQ